MAEDIVKIHEDTRVECVSHCQWLAVQTPGCSVVALNNMARNLGGDGGERFESVDGKTDERAKGFNGLDEQQSKFINARSIALSLWEDQQRCRRGYSTACKTRQREISLSVS